jgi:hypothetical protein
LVKGKVLLKVSHIIVELIVWWLREIILLGEVKLERSE